MLTVTLRSVLDAIAGLQGSEPYAVGDPDFVAAIASINRHLKRGWQHDFWPEWSPTERRAFRDDWSDIPTYAPGAEVYFPAGDAYYSANLSPNTPAAGESPLSHPEKWTALATFARYIALEQAGKTVISEVSRLCRNDPELNPLRPGEIPHTLNARGIVPLGPCGTRVYVTFRRPAPKFDATEFTLAEAVPAGRIRYDEASGDCYLALQASTGRAVTEAAYWEKVLFPARLENFVSIAAYADSQRGDDQTGKAQAEAANAELALVQAHDAVFGGQG